MDANALNAAMQQHQFAQCFNPDYLPCGIMVIPGTTWQWRSIASILLPCLSLLVGVFIGAPLLAREYDQRTKTFTWTQSVSPVRWLSSKLAVIMGAILIASGLLSLVTTWWGPIQDTIASSPWDTFMIRGFVPVAYTLFCLMAGVMIGAFIRRTLPAMALTLILLLLAQVLLSGSYPYLLPPSSQLDYYNHIQQQHLAGKSGVYTQDLFLGFKYVGPDGKVIEDISTYCSITPNPDNGNYEQAFTHCIKTHQVKQLVSYQRFNERFWPLQLVTTAILLLLTALFMVLTYWQLQRRTL
jgi:ABC-type transport system involved in multi-copper enzyme maturation permease subunit